VKHYRRSTSWPTHGFLPTITIFRPYYRPRIAAEIRPRGQLGGGRAAGAPTLRPVQKCAKNECKTTTIQPLHSHSFTTRAAGHLTRNLLRDWSQITDGDGSARLSAQECRDFELILFVLVMHKSLAAVLIQPLRRRTLGVVGDRLLARL
jgi:hypothetical protein